MPAQTAVFAQLENVLADLYRDEDSAARVATAAGIDVVRIAFKDRAIDNWHEIVREAEHQSKLPALLRVVTAEYPAYPPLQQVAIAYDDWVTAGRPAKPLETAPPAVAPAPHAVTPSPPIARRSRRWIAWLVAIIGLVAVVVVIYALQPQTAAVPNVYGKDSATASRALRQAGYEVVINGIVDPSVPEGQAIKTDPPAGARVGRGSKVILFVSTGAGTATVPNLKGELSEKARRILSDAGFQVELESTLDSGVSPGYVIKTIPPAGSPVAPGSLVTLVISAGAGMTTSPNVIGRDAREAQRLVEDAGFSVLVDKEYSPDIPIGRITRTDPPGDSQAEPGTRITLFESLGPAPATTATTGQITLVTGENGTMDNAELELTGAFPDSPYRIPLDQPNDLAPGQTDTYLFEVPAEFCQVAAFSVRKLGGPAGDDDWYLKEIYLMLDGVDIYFDAVADSLMTASSFPYGGGWSGTEAYRNRCGG